MSKIGPARVRLPVAVAIVLFLGTFIFLVEGALVKRYCPHVFDQHATTVTSISGPMDFSSKLPEPPAAVPIQDVPINWTEDLVMLGCLLNSFLLAAGIVRLINAVIGHLSKRAAP